MSTPAASPPIDPLDRGFLLGDGVFDTMAAADGRALLRDRHLDRLEAAAGAIGIPFDRAAVLGAINAAIADGGRGDLVIRTSLSRGVAPRGLWPAGPLSPTLLVTARPWDRTIAGQPARLATATSPRNERSVLSRIKSLSYLDNILAARDAADAGADDALVLNLAGRVAGSTIANLFALRGRMLATPPVSEGCLPGILRGLVIEEATSLGLEAVEAALAPGDLAAADGVFLTNSLRILRPVTAIDGSAIPVPPVLQTLLSHCLQRILRP